MTPIGAGLVFVVLVLLFALLVPVRTLVQQRSDLSRLQRDERSLEVRNAALQAQIARLHDPVYLERIARECLGMVRPGEIPFVIVGRNGAGGSSDSGAAGAGGAFDPSRPSGGC